MQLKMGNFRTSNTGFVYSESFEGARKFGRYWAIPDDLENQMMPE